MNYPGSTLAGYPDESIEILQTMRQKSGHHPKEEGPHTPQGKSQVDEDVNDLVENLQVPSPPASEISFRSFGTLSSYLDESIKILQTVRQKSEYHTKEEGPHTPQSKDQVDEDVNENLQVNSPQGSEVSLMSTLTGCLDESIEILQTMRQKSGYHPKEEKSRNSKQKLNEEKGPHTPQGKDQVDEDVNDFLENFQAHSPPASELSCSTLAGYLDESIEILQTMRQKSGHHPKEEGPHTPQGKSQVDEDVNDFAENLQAPSPPASEISFKSIGTLSSYLDESIKILQTIKQSQKGQESVHKTKKITGQSSDHRDAHNCHLCNKSFPNHRILVAHLKWVHNQCEYCDKIFKCQSDLSTHLKTHDGEKLYHCDQCSKSFTKTGFLDTHMERIHYKGRYRVKKEGSYQCIRCNKAYVSEGFLVRHLQVCKESPATLTNSDTHEIREVSNELRTATQSDITSNVESSEETLYQCDHCGKSFKKKGYLQKHIKLHDPTEQSDERSYQCNHCDKVFQKKKNLNQHQMTHWSSRRKPGNKTTWNPPQNPNYLTKRNKLAPGVITAERSVIGGQNRVISEDGNQNSAKSNDSSLITLNTHEVTPSRSNTEAGNDIDPNKDINEEQNNTPQNKESVETQNDIDTSKNKDLMDGDKNISHNRDLMNDDEFLENLQIPSPQR